MAAELLGDRALVDAVLDDYTTAPIGEPERALFAFIEKVALRANQIRQADVDAAKAAGWSDEALYDAITVGALFAFYNTWIDASGVHGQPPAANAAAGKRLARIGYVEPAAAPDMSASPAPDQR